MAPGGPRRCRSAPNLGRAARRRPLHRLRARRGDPARDVARRVPGGARRRHAGRRRDARRDPAARRSLSRPAISCRRRRSATRCCGSWCRARASTPGCRRCTTAACSAGLVPAVPGDHLPRGARLLPQVHGRRAHAADHPHPRAARDADAAGDRSTRASASRSLLHDLDVAGAARARAAAARRRQGGRRAITPSKASAWPSGCSTSGDARRRRARDRPVPHPPSPADVAGGVPARHRGSGNRPRVRRAGRHRGAAEDCSA